MIKPILSIVFIFHFIIICPQDESGITIIPQPYERALRNPLKGFTTNGISDHPWGSLALTYFKWNELENHETDGIENIINVSNQKWGSVAARHMKVIPRFTCTGTVIRNIGLQKNDNFYRNKT